VPDVNGETNKHIRQGRVHDRVKPPLRPEDPGESADGDRDAKPASQALRKVSRP
jgi:hypothetical protein